MTPMFNANPLAGLIATTAPTAAGSHLPVGSGAETAGTRATDELEQPDFLAFLQTLSIAVLENDATPPRLPQHPSAAPVETAALPVGAPGALPVQLPAAPALTDAATGSGPPPAGSILPVFARGSLPEATIGLPDAAATGEPVADGTEPLVESLARLPNTPASAARVARPALATSAPSTQDGSNPDLGAAAAPERALPEVHPELNAIAPAQAGKPVGGGAAIVSADAQQTLLLGADGAVSEVARGGASAAWRSAAPADAPVSLSRPAGSPGWDQALGQRIVWMADNGMGRAELRLDPPHLGNVNVRIAMHDDQAQVVFQAHNPAAREALESALPRLREMFADHGLALASAEVGGRDDGHADAGAGHRGGYGESDERPLDPRRPDGGDDGHASAEAGGDDGMGVSRVEPSLIDEYV